MKGGFWTKDSLTMGLLMMNSLETEMCMEEFLTTKLSTRCLSTLTRRALDTITYLRLNSRHST